MEINNSCSWNYLPNVVLDQIFSYLSWPDTINASSTCTQWRSGLYHPTYWKSLSFSLVNLNKDRAAKALHFINAFGKIVRAVNVTFDSLDFTSSSLTDELLSTLRDNLQLKKLILIPSYCALSPEPNSHSSVILNSSRMYHYILSILTKTEKFEELSIGCLEDIAAYSNTFLRLIAELHSKSIRVLGLASLKCDPEDANISSLEYHHLRTFTNLQILSVNYDNVDDHFLMVLQNCMSLKRIVVHIHSYCPDHPSTSEEAWSELTKYCPKVELRLNVIHSQCAVYELHKSILRKNMPLTHLRVFFCEQLNLEALDLLHVFHNTFKSLWWVDSPMYTDNKILLRIPDTYDVAIMNPFIFVAWRCTLLEELVLLGYRYFAEDLRAIIRLRGPVLKKIQVLRSEMTESPENTFQQETFRDIEKEVSVRIGKPWKALKKREVHPVLFCPQKYDSAGYLLPILCKDLE